MINERAVAGRHRAQRPRTRRRATVVAGSTAAVVLLGSATAFAYWSATGSGSGSAGAATMASPVVSVGTVTGTGLFPGLSANGTSIGGTLAVVASNPNPFPVTVTVSRDTASPVTGCATPDVSFAGGSFTLAANATDVQRTIAHSVSMGTNASNDCQGKTITIPLTTSSVSN